MLRSKLFACLLLLSSWAMAQPSDSLYRVQQNQITTLEQKVQNVEKQNAVFNDQLKGLKTQIVSLASDNESLNSALQKKQASIDSLANVVSTNSANIQTAADELGLKIKSTNEAVAQTSGILKAKTIWGIVAFIFAILASVVVWLLHKKGQKTSDDKIASLKMQADELNEKIVSQFNSEMSELQKIGDALKNANADTATEPDHSLVKKLVDRINFMEMTLHKMDSHIRGYNTLTNAINVMKIRLKEKEYEIIEWLGKDYDEGYNFAEVKFEDDEDLEEGKRIISEVMQPQINYKGKMIQAAKVKVNQNINE